MYREAIEKLIAWKNDSDRKPLVVNGARQVGKTWLLKEFGKKYYKNVAYVSMDNNKRMQDLFTEYNIDRLIQGLKIETGVNIEPQKTLIIFDEVQEIPNALTSLKYFNENANDYHIIVAGSLLGITIHDGVSFPVGKVNYLNMYPLNFREFLMAIGEKNLADLIKDGDISLIGSFSDKLKSYLREYYYIGGMPEVVSSYSKEKDYNRVRRIQEEILNDYKNDFSKHIPKKDLPRVYEVWNIFNTQLAKENKKFIFNAIKPSARASDYDKAINWLVNAGLLYQVNRVKAPKVPLDGYIDYDSFKLYFLDVGLLCAKNNLNVKTILEGNKIFTEYKGSLTEEYVLEEMKSSYNMPLYYWTSESNNAEIDYLIDYDSNVIPIEVKAEENLQAKSLKSFINKYNTETNIRTSMSNYRKEANLTNIPLYLIGSFDKYL